MKELVVVYELQLALLLGLAVAAVVLCVWMVNQVSQAFERPAVGPKEKLLGQIGRVIKPISAAQRGKILVMGEIWDAKPLNGEDKPVFGKGEEVRVVRFDKLEERVLQVERLR